MLYQVRSQVRFSMYKTAWAVGLRPMSISVMPVGPVLLALNNATVRPALSMPNGQPSMPNGQLCMPDSIGPIADHVIPEQS